MGRNAQQTATLSVLAAVLLVTVTGGILIWGWLSRAGLTGLGHSVDESVALIRSWGAWGVIGSIVLMTLHSFLPFPAEVVALANGMVYGPVWGAALTWVGAMIGASVAFGVARLLGRPFVQRLSSVEHRRRLAMWSHDRGGVTLLVSRLIPVIAFNFINFAAALTDISWWTFLWATGLGILPLTVVLAILGDRMIRLPLWSGLVIGTTILVAVLTAAVVRRRRRGRSG
ncbi:TVP38/TMEM64 family protein [bacterium]|nr:MAG: TVP38/TMEM64 family protein [bacterium]